MTEDRSAEEQSPAPKPQRELLAMVRPNKPWGELTDEEIDELTAGIHQQMLGRIRAIEDRAAERPS